MVGMKGYRRCDKCGIPSPRLFRDLVDPRMYKDIYINYCEKCHDKMLEKILANYK